MQPVFPVATADLKSKIDRVWDSSWSGGTSNPLEVIEQITYLLFIRRLDGIQVLVENKARLTGVIENPVFLPGQSRLRWSRFKNIDPEDMHDLIANEVFPFLRSLGGDGLTYSEHMKDARFTIPTPVEHPADWACQSNDVSDLVAWSREITFRLQLHPES